MTTRSLVLAITAAAVLAMGVYLFVQVRSSPADADVGPPSPPPAPPTPTTVHVNQTDHQAEPAPHVAGVTRPATVTPHSKVEQVAPSDEREPSENVDDLLKANGKLDAVMERANRAYDGQDYDEAKTIAGKVLAKQPGNVRMMRIMVSSSCIDGDVAVAQKYYPQLPKFDREQMKMRCDRYGVTLTDPQ